MRKILLIIISILLVILAYFSIAKGLKIGNFNISSVTQIKENSETLDKKIEEANRQIDTEYPNKISSLKTATNKMQKAKQEYLDLTNISSSEQILKATLQESYTIELLWTKVGRHAVSKGVNLNMEVTQGGTGTKGLYDLKFTVKGSYLAIINFVEALENDSVLNFRINAFKLLPSDGAILQATFTVKNVAIEGNTSSQSANVDIRNEQSKNSTTSDNDKNKNVN